MPLGGGSYPYIAAKPPVSEFESPKLKMAGNSHGGVLVFADTEDGTELTESAIRTVMTYVKQCDPMRRCVFEEERVGQRRMKQN